MLVYDETRQAIQRHALEHMVRAVRSTPVEKDPFPHFIVEGIFPADLYREMVARLPDKSLYDPFAYDRHSHRGVSNRARFRMTDESLNRLHGPDKSLWLGVRDALGAPEFKAAVFGQLRQGLAYRFGIDQDQVAGLPGYPLPELLRETSGYSIKPHPDTRKKVVTMQIALPADDTQAELGTEFYRRSLNPLHLWREPRGFEVVKRSPFLPNVGYAFPVLNTIKLKSWHGRTTLRGETGVRNTILNLWYASAAQANPDVVEQFYQAA